MSPEAQKLFLEHCQFALCELLDAYFEARKNNKERSLFKEYSLQLLNPEVDYLTLKSFSLLERPITCALRNAIRLIGEDLHAQSGEANLMRQAMAAVATSDEGTNVFRTAILDKMWDGIGDWRA